MGRGTLAVTSVRPVGPAGQSPFMRSVAGRPSSTTSHERLVWASHPTNRVARDSASTPGSMPIAATAAAAYPDSTEDSLVALTQTSRSSSPDRHNDSAMWIASWVLPQAPSQSGEPGAGAALPGARTTVLPLTRDLSSPGADSMRGTNPSARGGTMPDRIGHAVPPLGVSPDPAAGTRCVTRPLPATRTSQHLIPHANGRMIQIKSLAFHPNQVMTRCEGW